MLTDIATCIKCSNFNLKVFAGFLININSLGDWLSWLQYLSIFRYSLHVRKYVILHMLEAFLQIPSGIVMYIYIYVYINKSLLC